MDRAARIEQDNVTRFLEIILRGNRVAAYELLSAALAQHDVAYVYEKIVSVALRKIGHLWVSDVITIADEHIATATANVAVASLYHHFPWPAQRRSRALIACPGGEQHAFGARMLADLLALDGWEEIYFGADVPPETLAAKAAQLSPRLVALSVTIAPNLEVAREAVSLIRLSCPQAKILLGGRAAVRAPDAAMTVGADAVVSTASEAVRMAHEWR